MKIVDRYVTKFTRFDKFQSISVSKSMRNFPRFLNGKFFDNFIYFFLNLKDDLAKIELLLLMIAIYFFFCFSILFFKILNRNTFEL